MHRSTKLVQNEVPELHIKVSYEAQFSTTLKVKKYFAENMCILTSNHTVLAKLLYHSLINYPDVFS